jgi:phosphate starvation-inducible membrane PsiE
MHFGWIHLILSEALAMMTLSCTFSLILLSCRHQKYMFSVVVHNLEERKRETLVKRFIGYSLYFENIGPEYRRICCTMGIKVFCFHILF